MPDEKSVKSPVDGTLLVKRNEAALIGGPAEGSLVVDEVVITEEMKTSKAKLQLHPISVQTSVWFLGTMAGEENIVDPFDNDQELARAVEQMFQEEEMENERGEDEIMPMEVEAINATPLESLPGSDVYLWISFSLISIF